MPSKFYLINPDSIFTIEPLTGSTLDDFRRSSIEIIMFNVGEGDAILVKTRTRALFVDGGAKRKKRNEELGIALRKYLDDKNIKLDTIIPSHNHVDHLNALSTMLRDSPNDILEDEVIFYHNGEQMGKWLQDTLIARINQINRIGQQQVPEFLQIDWIGNQQITMFTDGKSKPSPAYKSIFMHIPFRGASFLLTGDAYIAYEKKLIEDDRKRNFLTADVLKITHHGSEDGTGEEFLDYVRPAIAFSSSTSDHHHRLEQEVKDRLAPHRTKIFDTHVDGDIIIRTDGHEWESDGDTGILYEVETNNPGIFNPNDH